jgi:hypothetical protein
MKKDDIHREWEEIAMRILTDPHASRSEVDTAIIGVRGSENEWLKERLEEKRVKAWKAKNVKDD